MIPLPDLLSKFIHEDENNCWVWSGRLNNDGYAENPYRTVHKFIYVMTKGVVPDGLVLDHLCRVRNCVNPDHLEPVTSSENCKRQIKQPICSNGHNDWRINTNRSRRCRTCQNETIRKYREKKRGNSPT